MRADSRATLAIPTHPLPLLPLITPPTVPFHQDLVGYANCSKDITWVSFAISVFRKVVEHKQTNINLI